MTRVVLLFAGIACITACQIPVRIGGTTPTREGLGGGGLQGMVGVSVLGDLGHVRLGGGAILDIVETDAVDLVAGGAQIQADIILHRVRRRRQVVLATRVSGSGGSKGHSFGAFIGPALALRGRGASSDSTWHHFALGFTAQNITFEGESAWFLGGAVEVAYAIDFERIMGIGR